MSNVLYFGLLTCVMFLAACSRDAAPAATGANEWLGPVVVLHTPSAPGARFPHLAGGDDGLPVVMSWLEPTGQDAFALRQSRIVDGAWGDAVGVASGADWFINWADFPSVVPVTSKLWVAHWLQQRPDNVYSYDVRIAASHDAGRSWSRPYTPHDDGTPTEHGFASIALAGGQPYAVWLDGRNTNATVHEHDEHADDGGAMTLRGAALGVHAAADGAQIDDRVCDCCQTDAVRSGGGVAVVYRDRGDDETRNINLVRFDAGQWSEPVVVHDDGWRIDACPVNGPAIDAHSDVVAVAWFTAPDQPRVRLAFSTDGGRSFTPAIEVATGNVIGRVDVVMLDAAHAVVSWLEDMPGGAEFRARPFTAEGPSGRVSTIARSAIARSSGFPQMVRDGNRLLFAWTEAGDSPQLRTAVATLR